MIYKTIYNKTQKSPILSICMTVKNRSRVVYKGKELLILRKTLDSCKSAIIGRDIEIVITDWASTDDPLLNWVPQDYPNLPIKIVNIDGQYFSRGIGLNVAIECAQAENLFITDADVLLTKRIIGRGLKGLSQNKALFIQAWNSNEQGVGGSWSRGCGLAFVKRDWWRKAGKIPQWNHWGWEDSQFRCEIAKLKIMTLRRKLKLIHQWHPPQREHYEPNSGSWLQKRNKYINGK